MILGTVAPS